MVTSMPPVVGLVDGEMLLILTAGAGGVCACAAPATTDRARERTSDRFKAPPDSETEQRVKAFGGFSDSLHFRAACFASFLPFRSSCCISPTTTPTPFRSTAKGTKVREASPVPSDT